MRLIVTDVLLCGSFLSMHQKDQQRVLVPTLERSCHSFTAAAGDDMWGRQQLVAKLT